MLCLLAIAAVTHACELGDDDGVAMDPSVAQANLVARDVCNKQPSAR